MKSQIRKNLSLALTLGLITSGSAFCQSMGGGNGGDPNEVAEFTGLNGQHLDSWSSVKGDLIQGFESNRHRDLDLKGIDADSFKAQALDALHVAKVEWDEKEIMIQGVKRPCENFKDQLGLHIHCNQNAYASVMKNYDSETEYKMIAHEYLSLAGLEPNTYGLSDYPFSSQISSKLQLIEVKRWAVKNPIRKGFQCEISKTVGSQNYILKFQAFDHQSRVSVEHWVDTGTIQSNQEGLFNFEKTEYHTDPRTVALSEVNLDVWANSEEDLRHASSSLMLSNGKTLSFNAFVVANQAVQGFKISLDGKNLGVLDAHCIPVEFSPLDFKRFNFNVNNPDPFYLRSSSLFFINEHDLYDFDYNYYSHDHDLLLSVIHALSNESVDQIH